MSRAPKITHAELLAMLHYDPETGNFTWRQRADRSAQWNGRYAGKVAGYDWTEIASGCVYRSIRIHDWPFLGHRLAWFYMLGVWPDPLVDHCDLDGLNNRWSNLREATKAQNGANTRAHRTNKLGLKGVCICKQTGRFRANIRVEGRQTFLGNFETAAEAHAAYEKAAIVRSGEFARAS